MFWRKLTYQQRLQWGDISASKDGNALCLHVLQLPEFGAITVSDLPSAAPPVSFIANGEKANFFHQGTALEIMLPAKPLNGYDTVVKVTPQEPVD